MAIFLVVCFLAQIANLNALFQGNYEKVTTPFAVQAATTPITVEDNSTNPAITYAGTWTSSSNANYSGGTVKYATASTASASISLSCTQLTFYSTKANNLGK